MPSDQESLPEKNDVPATPRLADLFSHPRLFPIALFFSFALLVLIIGIVFGRSYLILQASDSARTIDQIRIETDEDGNQTVEARELLAQLQNVEEQANAAVTSAELILSFIEATTVLVGVIAAIAALYGFSQIREIQKDYNDLINPVRGQLEKLSESEERLQKLQAELEEAIDDVTWFLQADQEFRLNNYEESHRFAEHVLKDNEEHPLALYMAGWLKVHHRGGTDLDEGVKLLEKLKTILEKRGIVWATAQAAYGVGLRRKARALRDVDQAQYRRKLREAETEIEKALEINENLMDFNHESFWGSVGGIRRDLGRIDEAITAYEKALKVTPASSYPQGNLATLYFHKAHETTTPQDKVRWLEKTREAFKRARDFAIAELANRPNDYYHAMDVAMSSTMLGEYDNQGQEYLHRAIATNVPSNILDVSLTSGWQELMKYCPDNEEWGDIRQDVQKAIDIMEDAITERKVKEAAEAEKSGPSGLIVDETHGNGANN